MKPIKINGVTFRFGQVEWEDACGQMRAPLPDFNVLRRSRRPAGKIINTVGLVAQVGTYIIVISEHGVDEVFDFTLIPTRAKVKISYTGSHSHRR
jgi:hypothetical protein